MKNKIILSSILMLGFISVEKAQNAPPAVENNEDAIISQTDKETIQLNNSYNFTISKIDNKTNKKLFDVVLSIPDKDKKEYYYPGVNKISTVLVDNQIQIIYDVWSKNEKQKNCYLKTLGKTGSPLSEEKLLSSAPCKSMFSNSNTNFRVIYSPDKSKFALLLDNFSKGIVIEPSITIYDSKKFSVLATKQLKSKYNGNKMQIDPYNFKMDNTGNINLNFNTLTDETNIVLKSFQAEIPYADSDFKNIKEIGDTPSEGGITGETVNKLEHGRFYNTLDDYTNNKFVDGYKVKNGSYSMIAIAGEFFYLIDKNGTIDKTNVSKFPAHLFTYKSSDLDDFYLLRADEGKCYIVLAAGKFSYYAEYGAQGVQHTSDGIDGEMRKFKEKDLEEALDKAGLLGDYKKDKPKREMHDTVNDYFNKTVSWHLKYINMLNKM